MNHPRYTLNARCELAHSKNASIQFKVQSKSSFTDLLAWPQRNKLQYITVFTLKLALQTEVTDRCLHCLCQKGEKISVSVCNVYIMFTCECILYPVPLRKKTDGSWQDQFIVAVGLLMGFDDIKYKISPTLYLRLKDKLTNLDKKKKAFRHVSFL